MRGEGPRPLSLSGLQPRLDSKRTLQRIGDGPGGTLKDPARKEEAGKCSSCHAAFGDSLRDKCEEALSQGQRVIRIICGGCGAKLLVSIDQVGRLGISLD